MSLLDALLLESHPFDLWIALRKDSCSGSGTIDDPYDGSVRAGPPRPLSSLVKDSSDPTGRTAIATLAGHGFSDRDAVTVSGATEVPFNGTFPIFGVQTDTFKYYMTAPPASSSAGGSPTCARLVFRFDEVMKTKAGPTMVVRLGPGTFETRGYTDSAPPIWQPKTAQRILGSGIGVTVLKLVHASVPDAHYFAIGGAYNNVSDHFEVADLTVDCNLAGQKVLFGQSGGTAFAQVVCGAIRAAGSHIKIRQVRAIGFGTQTPKQECFVIGAAGAHPDNPQPVNCLIEDCIVDSPSINNVRETSCLIMYGGERSSDGDMVYPRGCVIRNSFVDCQYQDRPVAIEKIEISGSVATVTTRGAHGRANGDYVVISGALVSGSLVNPYNGSYAITDATSNPNQFKYTLTGYSGLPIPTQQPSGEMYVDRFPSRFVLIADISVLPPYPSRTVKIKTATPHNRKAGNNVTLAGVSVGPNLDPRFNDSFPINANGLISPVELEFTLKQDFLSSEPKPTGGVLGVDFHALNNDGGTAAVVEGCSVFHCWIGGPYHDSFNTRDLITRRCYFHDIVGGPAQNMGAVSFTTVAIPLQSLSITNQVATAVTAKPHGLRASERVNISGASIAEANGERLLVTETTGAFTFKYDAPGAPNGTATGAKYLLHEKLPKLLESLTRVADGDEYLVTAETTYDVHGLGRGDAVEITNAGHWDLASFPNSTRFNGSFRVEDAPTPKTFRYRIKLDPGIDSSTHPNDFSSGYFARIWQARKLTYEDNLFELPSWNGAVNAPPAPIAVTVGAGANPRTNPYTFWGLIMRGNVVGHVDSRYGLVDNTQSRGLSFASAEKALIEENIVEPGPASTLQFSKSGEVKLDHNLSPSGQPIRGYDFDTGDLMDDTATAIEDAMLMALL